MSQGLREQLIGSWGPASYAEEAADGGGARAPRNEKPRGLIMYTPGGYMSGQLP